MSKPLKVKNLFFQYPDGHRVLNDINFEVHDGDTICLLGPNGAGKTTLMFCLAGLFEFSGEVEVLGEKLNKKNFGNIRRKIGFLFQNPDDQFFMPTVFDDVAFGISNDGFSNDEIKLRVKSALEQVGLSDSFDRLPHHLSFGEKKRVALAGVLITSPKLMLLDEPTLGLDPPGRRKFIEILKSIRSTKIIATHDVELSSNLATRIIYIESGRILKDGPPAEILSSDELKFFI